jgi:hypothetical protein
LAERGEFELPVPISEQVDYKKMAGFAAPGRIIGIARGSNAGLAYTVGNISKETFPSRMISDIATDVAAAIQ